MKKPEKPVALRRETLRLLAESSERHGRLTDPASSMDSPMKLMEFKDGDRVFVCRAESSPATPRTLWWWISVTGESSRYAAFHAESGDTEARLRPRILAFYQQMLADRARPPMVRQHWAQRRAAPSGAEGATPTAAIPASPSGSPSPE